jgi:hypothetical protein
MEVARSKNFRSRHSRAACHDRISGLWKARSDVTSGLWKTWLALDMLAPVLVRGRIAEATSGEDASAKFAGGPLPRGLSLGIIYIQKVEEK